MNEENATTQGAGERHSKTKDAAPSAHEQADGSAGELEISLKAHEVFSVGGVPITNTVLMAWLVVILVSIFAFLVGQNLKKIPSKSQAVIEFSIATVLDYIQEVLGSRDMAKRYFPLIMTIFLFILAGNWLGLIPGIEAITVATSHGETTLFHPIATDLNVTLALAIIAFLAIEVIGVSTIGFLKYASKFVNVRSVIGFFVGLIELLSEVVRLVSFSFRLFGNIFAGKVLILVALFFVPFVAPVPLMLYEVFVGFIQAAIFALLTLFFIKIAIEEPH